MKHWLAGALMIASLFIPGASAQGTNLTIARTPYLQNGTWNSMDVRWRTNLVTNSRVRYGFSMNALIFFAEDSTITTEHHLKLTGLLPDTRYYYAVGTTNLDLEGNDANHYFYTSPFPFVTRPIRFWILGDPGNANPTAANVRDAFYAFNGKKRVDGWLMLGDNAYPDGTDDQYQAAIFDMFKPTLNTVSLWPTIGNHDTAESPTPPPTLPYFNIFSPPEKGEAGGVPSGTIRYYSFNYGNIHFICLDSMTSDRTPTGPMLTWLKQDLAANRQRWTVAFWHHPPYASGVYGSDQDPNCTDMRENALPILEAADVDLVFAGHIHQYERSYLINGEYGLSNTFNPATMLIQGGNGLAHPYLKPGLNGHEGTVYVTAGSSSRDEDPSNFGAMMASSYIEIVNFGSVVLDVNGDAVTVTFIRDNGTIPDVFEVHKGKK